jgi:hypothetical protein
MYSCIMPLSATPGRMTELAAVRSSKVSVPSLRSRERMAGDSM